MLEIIADNYLWDVIISKEDYDDIDDIFIESSVSIAKYNMETKKIVEFREYSIAEFNNLLSKDMTILPEKVIQECLEEGSFRKEGDLLVVNI